MIHHFRPLQPVAGKQTVCGITAQSYTQLEPFPESEEKIFHFWNKYVIPLKIEMCENCMYEAYNNLNPAKND